MDASDEAEEELRRDGVGDIRIPAPVTLTEILSERTYRGTLPNGKVILVYEKRNRVKQQQRHVGEHVTVGLSLCDFSSGAIVD
jgi:hypothetical protein